MRYSLFIVLLFVSFTTINCAKAKKNSNATFDKLVWSDEFNEDGPINSKNFTEIYVSDHPIDSVINIGKEFAKHFVSILGNKKYAMHKENDLVKITNLDDGQLIYEFINMHFSIIYWGYYGN